MSEEEEIRTLEARLKILKAAKQKSQVPDQKSKPKKKNISNENQFYKRRGTTDRGKHYEDYMVANLILECIKNDNIQNFKISSNDDNFGAFDDVILEIKWQDQTEEKWALQLKHNNAGKLLPLNSLTANTGNFSIPKYFKSFQENKSSIPEFNLILMTNLKFDAQDGTQIQISDDESFQVKIYRTKAKELLKTAEKKKDCYRFEIVNSVSVCPFSEKMRNYEDFFNKFYLYTDQADVDNIEKYVAEKFKTLFGCDNSFSDKYIKFIEKWSQQEGIKEKLDRNMMQKVIAMDLVSPFLCPFSFGPVHENAKILQSAVNKFTVTLVDESSLDKCRRLWGDAKDILEKIDIREINRVRRKYDPNCEFVDNLNKLNPKECTQLLWFIDTKIPLIVFEDGLIFQAIKLCQDRAYVLIRDNKSNTFPTEYTTFEKLSNLTIHFDIMNDLTRNFKCKLPGSEVSLDYFIRENENFQEIITTNELLEMMDKPYNMIKEEQEKLPVPYISRYLSNITIDFKYLKTVEENTFIVLSNENCKESKIKDYYNRKNFLITTEYSNEEFQVMCRNNKKIKKIHHFRIINGGLQLIRSIGDISDIKKYQTERFIISEATFYDPDKHNNINVIIDEPGMGKSVLLQSLKNNISSNLWTILLLPSDISEICHFARKENDQNKIDDFIVDLKYAHYKKFDKMILQLLMKKGKIVYLWDALDEIILDEDLEPIMELIHKISTRDPIQWITSRRHLKEILEYEFNTFSLKINSFDDEQQTCYISDRLKTEENIEEITKTIKNNITFAANTDIVGIPLQLFMLTELFLQNEETYRNLINNQLLSLTDLYGYFVEETFNFHNKTKNKIPNVTPLQKRKMERGKRNKIKNYKEAALKLLIEKSVLSELNIKCNEFLDEIQKDGDDIGFVIGITADREKVQFVHNSYAEYFVALYFSENYKDIHVLDNILFQKKYANIRFLFDCLLAKNSFPHIAILNKNLETLKKCEDPLKHCKDLGGRSLLHLAASWGENYPLYPLVKDADNVYRIHFLHHKLKFNPPKYSHEILEYVLEKCDVEELDHLFELNCLSYAEKSGCLLNVLTIESCKRTGYFNSKEAEFICNCLFYSSIYGYEDIFESHSYINNYCNVVTNDNETLLHVACSNGHFKIVKFLITFGIEVNCKNDMGCTPLHYAARNGYNVIAKELIKSGAVIDSVAEQDTPLHIAADKVNDQRVVIEIGLNDLWTVDDQYDTKSVFLNNIEQLLFDFATTIDFTDLDGFTPLHAACQNGHQEVVQLLIDCGATVDLANKNGFTPLHAACQRGYQGVADLLINYGATVDLANKDGFTPLYMSSQYGRQDMVQLLINSGATVDLAIKNGFTPLHAACQNNYQSVVKLLINSGATVDLANKDGFTPLHMACQNGHQEVVQLLINFGATVDLADKDRHTPLYMACQNGHQHIVQLLINFGATIDLADKDGFTPLYLACYNGYQEVVQLLINSGATVDVANNAGFTPLYLACQNGHQEIVQLLINSGATVDLATKDGATPLHLACQNGHQDVVQFLITSEATVDLANKDGFTSLFLACQNGHQQIVQLLINFGAKIDLASKDGFTPLYAACRNDHQEVVQLLINSGATVDLPNIDMFSPLVVACERGHQKVVQLLINSGATVNLADIDLSTSLYGASQNGLQGIVQCLIESGVTIDLANKYVFTPLYIACKNGHQDVVQLLINSGATIDLPAHKYGYSPLVIACELGHYEVAQHLINSGATIDLANFDGLTPLLSACLNGHLEVVQLLINSGAPIDLANKYGFTPLHAACQNGHLEVVQLLINSGATIDQPHKDRFSPLVVACECGHQEVVQLLINSGATVDLADKEGSTPLYGASQNDHQGVVQLLINSGASVDLAHENGSTPLFVASQNGHQDIVQLLIKSGAAVNRANKDGFTPLYAACQNNQQDIVQLLINSGGLLTHQDGTAPLNTTF